MHVVFIITRGDAVGGATVHVRDLARELLQRGERATVLVGGTGEAHEEFVRHGIPCESLPALRRAIHPLHDAAGLFQIVAALRRLKPDVVSAHTAKAGWLGRVAAKLVGVPVLFTAHGWAIDDRVSRRGGRVFAIAERMAAPWATTIVNVCEAERALAERCGIGPRNRLEVIHNGVYDVAAELQARPETDPPRLVMVARFEPPKDQMLLLAALARLQDREWTLEFVGGGPTLERVKDAAVEHGLEQRVVFPGPSRDVAGRLSRAQIFVLTSHSEGFPRSILEAMRAGLPVVASDVGGIAEAVTPETGVLVPRGDAGALTQALGAMIGNPRLRAELGRAGRIRYQQHFTFSTTFSKTFAIYGRIRRGPQANLAPAGEQAGGRE